MNARKGIAIQLETQLLKKLDDQDIPRNDVINKALALFLTQDEKKDKAFVEVEKEEQPSIETTSEDLYNEIYSNLYNTEIIPLKNQLIQQRELIETLKDEIEEYRKDKAFLKQQIEHLFEQPPKKLSRYNKKRRQREIRQLQEQDDESDL